MPAVETRSATPADAEQALAVLRDSITHLCELDHQNDAPTLERWLSNKTPEQFGRWLADPSTYLVVALFDTTVAGVAALHQSGEIRLCYVRPGRTGLGVGRALLDAVESQARAWSIQELRLNSSRTALHFYERCGYEPAGEARAAFGVLRDYPHTKRLGESEQPA